MTVLDILDKYKYMFHICSVIIFFLLIINSSANEVVIEIDNPKFSEKGLDDKIYEIKAKKGLKSGDDLKLFLIEAKFKTKEGTWIFLEAEKGSFIQTQNFITLDQNITFYTEEKETLFANFATFDMEKDIIQFQENIKHQNNNGIITAEKSTISNDFNNIFYQGNVTATLIRN
jgi:hypothetical protein